MAEPHDRKPILTIEQQIEHLKQKGVAFELCSEEEAADYLRDKCNFFKLASYRKLFSKYEGGPRDGRYVDLDFGQLRLARGARPGAAPRPARHDARHRAFPEGDTASRDGGPRRGRLRHRGRLHGIAYHCKQGVPPARAQDERPQPLQLEPLREVLRRHARLGLP